MTDASTEREDEGAWSKLRRRKVVQWGLAYSAGAWGFLQGLEYVGNTFDWSRHIQQLATIVLLIGLPVTVVLAWYHGDRGHQKPVRSELAILILIFLIGGGVVWFFGRQGEATMPASTVVSTPPAEGAMEARPSIAVLPFENRSRLEDDAFLVDGIHDDILTQLSKIGSMKVIARTSVEQFRDTQLSMREIGKRLGVANVLEGGVQRAGDRVRITVQLIDAGSESHLWAESYDRELTATNIFEIQSEIAKAIAGALQAALMPAERARLVEIPTHDLAAWEAYQNGRRLMAKRTITELSEAQGLFRKAIEIDPKFALAYAALADATWLAADFGSQPMEPATAQAEELIGQALRLDPNLAEARVTLAKFAEQRREFERAESLYREAIALNPSYPEAHRWYSQLLAREGRDDEALRSLQRAAELDPMSVSIRTSLAWALSGNGKFDESLRGFDLASRIDPLSPHPYSGIGSVTATAFGRLDRAIPYLNRALDLEPASYWTIQNLAQVRFDLGDDAQVDRLQRYATANAVLEPLAAAYLYMERGDQEAALAISRKVLEIDSRNSMALRLLRDADLRNGDAMRARARYQQAFPELLQRDLRTLDWTNFAAAVDLSVVLQAMGEREQAALLLDQCDSIVSRMPRLGPWGYWVADAQILAIRGRSRDALDALRSAERSLWRGPYWRYHRDFDPALASIRDDPEFKTIFDEIERDMARQRAELAKRPMDAPLPLPRTGS